MGWGIFGGGADSSKKTTLSTTTSTSSSVRDIGLTGDTSVRLADVIGANLNAGRFAESNLVSQFMNAQQKSWVTTSKMLTQALKIRPVVMAGDKAAFVPAGEISPVILIGAGLLLLMMMRRK